MCGPDQPFKVLVEASPKNAQPGKVLAQAFFDKCGQLQPPTADVRERAKVLVLGAFAWLAWADENALSACEDLLKRDLRNPEVIAKKVAKGVPVIGPGVTLGIEGSKIGRLRSIQKAMKPASEINPCLHVLRTGMKRENEASTRKLTVDVVLRVGAAGGSQGLDFGLGEVIGTLAAQGVESATFGLAAFLGDHGAEHMIDRALKIPPDVWAAYLAAPARLSHLASDAASRWRRAESYRLALRLLLGCPLGSPWATRSQVLTECANAAHVCLLFDQLHDKDWNPDNLDNPGYVNLPVLVGMNVLVSKAPFSNLLSVVFQNWLGVSSDKKKRAQVCAILEGDFLLPNVIG